MALAKWIANAKNPLAARVRRHRRSAERRIERNGGQRARVPGRTPGTESGPIAEPIVLLKAT